MLIVDPIITKINETKDIIADKKYETKTRYEQINHTKDNQNVKQFIVDKSINQQQ